MTDKFITWLNSHVISTKDILFRDLLKIRKLEELFGAKGQPITDKLFGKPVKRLDLLLDENQHILSLIGFKNLNCPEDYLLIVRQSIIDAIVYYSTSNLDKDQEKQLKMLKAFLKEVDNKLDINNKFI